MEPLSVDAETLVLEGLRQLAGVSIVFFDRDMRILDVRGAALEQHGYLPERIIGRRAPDVLPATAWEHVGPLYTRALTGETVTTQLHSVDGLTVYEATFQPVRRDGVLVGGMVTARDVTEQHASDRRHAEDARLFRAMAESSLEGHCRYSADGVLQWASPAMKDFTGRSAEELVRRQVTTVIHPADVPARDAAFATMQRTREPQTIELRARHADGTWRWVESTVRGSFGADGELVEIHTTSRDITQRREDEDLRRQWELVFQTIDRGMAWVDPDTNALIRVNPACARMHGGTPEDYAGVPLATVFSDAFKRQLPTLAVQLKQDRYVRYESEHVRQDGSTFPVMTETFTAQDEDGRVLYRLAFLDDLTDQRAQQAAGDQAKALFEAAFERAPIGQMITRLQSDGDTVIVKCNAALAQMLGTEPDEILGSTNRARVHPDDLPIRRRLIEHALAGHPTTGEIRFRHADGRDIWTLASPAKVQAADGETLFLLQVMDISARKAFEARLQHLADHDALTGLFGRRRLEEELLREVARRRRHGGQACLLLLDLDGFKAVNDSLGHMAGDKLLLEVGAALRRGLRDIDVPARLGGDEFAVLLPDTGPGGARATAARIVEAVRREAELVCAGTGVVVTASVGMTTIHRGTRGADQALARADRAMYRAKAAGKNQVAICLADDDDEAEPTTDAGSGSSG
jgi:diguanylate cyclase (GGDEF)-like protein/PAS domain S-box-containing protein